jgi:hypothetical protein
MQKVQMVWIQLLNLDFFQNHIKKYGTGQLRYDPKTGLVVPKKTSNKYQHEYV